MPKIILLTNQKGGVGKSTITFNTAISLANHSKVAIIDFDPQGSLIQINDLVKDLDILSVTDIKEIPMLDYDFIIIDTPPYLSSQLSSLIDIADLIIIPTKAGILDVLAIQNTIDLLAKQNAISKCLILLNLVKANTTLTMDILLKLEEYNIPIANNHISDLVSITRSVLTNGVINDKNALKQINALVTEILTKLISM